MVPSLMRSGAGDTAFILSPSTQLTWQSWLDEVAGYYMEFLARDERRILLHEPDFTRFSILLMALLAAGKQVLICANGQPDWLRELAPQCDLAILPEPMSGLSCWIDNVKVGSVSPQDCPSINDQQELIFFTSGSSGKPKAIVKQWRQLCNEADAHASLWGIPEGALVLSSVSHLHIYGLLFKLVLPLRMKLPVFAPQIQFPEQLHKQLTHAGPCLFISSPAYLSRVAEYGEFGTVSRQPWLTFSSGGPLPPRVGEQFELAALSPPAEIFGSTETGGIAWRRYPDRAWQPLPGVEISSGEAGRIRLRSPWQGGDRQSWYKGDDAICLHDNGQFDLLGRLDRIVKLEEKRLSLDEVEDRLRQHPQCIQAKALLLQGKRPQLGVVVQIADLGSQDKPELIGALKQYLSRYFEPVLLPKKWRLVAELPVDSQGKTSLARLNGLFTK